MSKKEKTRLPLSWLYPELIGKDLDALKGIGIEPGHAVVLEDGNRPRAIPLAWLEDESPPGPGSVVVLPVPGSDPDPCLEAALDHIEKNGSSIPSPMFPLFLTRFDAAPGTPETRLPRSYEWLLPGDHYPGKTRELTRRLVRSLFPGRYYLFLVLENMALSGVDLDLEAGMLRNFRLIGTPPRRVEKPVFIAIGGIDGSGKSSHLSALKDFLVSRGFKVRMHKIYRHGVFHDTVTDLTRQCKGGKNLHLWRIQRIAKAFDSVKYYASTVAPDMHEYDILLFDRYIHTHLSAGANRFHHDPFTREFLLCYPSPHKFFLMDIDPENALERIGERSKKTVDENIYMLSRFREGLLNLARAEGHTILDATAPFERNQETIRNEVEEFLERTGRL